MALPPPVYPTQWGTVQPAQPYDPEKAAEALRKAMKGLGTNEDAIIQVLTSHCNAQRQEIEKKYKQMHGRDLRSDLKSELSGRFEDVALALLDHPRVYDAQECNEAIKVDRLAGSAKLGGVLMHDKADVVAALREHVYTSEEQMDHHSLGAGTNEETLIEILATRSNTEIAEIKSQYKTLYKRDLERDIQGDTSGDFKRLLTSLVTGAREDRPQVDVDLAKKEAQELFQAGEKQVGTDEATFNRILCLRSFPQLQETFKQYKAISGKEIEKSVISETSGSLERGLLAVVKAAKHPGAFFAERLHSSMKGAGTNDRALIRIVVSRSEIDMVIIKQEFHKAYGKTLASFIKDDAAGDYKKTLLAIVKD